MLPRVVFAVTVLIFSSSIVVSETFLATITKVEGNKITIKKATYHPADVKFSFAEPVMVEVTKDAALTWGHFDPREGRIDVKTVAVEGGLNNVIFKKVNAGKAMRPSLITIADQGVDKGKITAINL